MQDTLAVYIHYATRGGLIYFFLAAWLWFSQKPKNKLLAVLGAVSCAATYLTTDILLKPLVGRLRPFQILQDAILIPPSPGSHSFPSGQAAAAFAAAMICFLVLPESRLKYFILGFAFLVGLDRIYMGHHYPSDVFAGALIGILISFFVYKFYLKVFAGIKN